MRRRVELSEWIARSKDALASEKKFGKRPTVESCLREIRGVVASFDDPKLRYSKISDVTVWRNEPGKCGFYDRNDELIEYSLPTREFWQEAQKILDWWKRLSCRRFKEKYNG